ncbi:MAG: hypothetical protein K2X66_09265, partial [Cyanobacteria bacterium]|nr:hypothetical protein [Cyanobacteriota bacterium]
HLLDVFFHSVFQNKAFQQHPLLKALNALHEMVQQPQELDKWAQVFGEQMPFIMDQSTGQDIGSLFKYLEDGFDHRLFPKNYHPNEAELMLLLRHPDLMDRQNLDLLSPLTTGLTSITRFIEKDITLTDSVVKAWGDIGLLTHGFRFWKFDTIGAQKSLLAAFGFQPFPANRPLDDVFGKGFVFEDPDSKILFEMRRGYLLATHPDHGTLVVRNSSTVFGRDLLKHPAYYLPVDLSKTNLLTFDPRNIKEDWHILNREVYTSEKQRNGMVALTEGLMGLKENYRRFKLDTEAFEGYGNQRKFVGHLSPGLPKLVNRLIHFQELSQSTGKPLPDLAFVNPDYPIYEPYGRFSLTPQQLQELQDFVKGQWSESKYPNSAWIQFLKDYGVSNRGELVMIDPVAST